MLNVVGNASQPLMGLMSSAMTPFKPKMAPVVLPAGVPQNRPPTSSQELESVVSAVYQKRKEWANLQAPERAILLRECISTALQATEAAAELMVRAKGSYGNGAGEERSLLITPVVAMREYAEALEAGARPKPRRLFQRPSGQYVADVLPQGLEALFFGGYRGEVWIQKGEEPTQGKVYRELDEGVVHEGSLALCLGAGNQVSVLLLDILHLLIAENSVVVCKFNPVLSYLGPYAEEVLEPLVSAGFVAFVYGGAAEGKLLCHHKLVERVHLTGSWKTYDAIVWDGKPKTGRPPLSKAVTAELGCVTPYIIVPGKWSHQAVEYYADECVAGLVNNAGHNCTKLELLITAKDWPQREQFIAAVRARLSSVPKKVAWYPGSDQKVQAFRDRFKDADALGVDNSEASEPSSYHPWLFKSDLSPEEADTQTENWCGVLQEVTLPGFGPDSAAFLDAAVAFANDKCWGSLSCTVVSPPETDAAALDRAVENLRYGAVCVNLPSFAAYAFPKLSWGAYPGNTLEEIGSGVGVVHNSQLYDHVEKSVMYSSWIQHPTHLWSTKVRNLDATTSRAIRFLAYPSLWTLLTTAVQALKG